VCDTRQSFRDANTAARAGLDEVWKFLGIACGRIWTCCFHRVFAPFCSPEFENEVACRIGCIPLVGDNREMQQVFHLDVRLEYFDVRVFRDVALQGCPVLSGAGLPAMVNRWVCVATPTYLERF
jgi:hypothetical protein